VNWYAALVLIVVLGLASVAFARYEYRNSPSPSALAPQKGTTWYSGFVFDICGKLQPSPPATANTSKLGMWTTGSGVMVISPKNSSQAGTNANLDQFVSGYPGMKLTSSTIQSPGTKALSNGDTCPAGTPDAGKPGAVTVGYWASFSDKKPEIVSGDPTTLRPGDESRITMAFLPAGATPTQPPGSVVEALFSAVQSTTTTLPTTTPSVSTTVVSPSAATSSTVPATVPASTTPTTAKAATTIPSTTPTTSPTTSTTKPKG
jgi:hypothetical protein